MSKYNVCGSRGANFCGFSVSHFVYEFLANVLTISLFCCGPLVQFQTFETYFFMVVFWNFQLNIIFLSCYKNKIVGFAFQPCIMHSSLIIML